MKKNPFGVLVTDDHLYYVIYTREPFVKKENAIKLAEKLNSEIQEMKD